MILLFFFFGFFRFYVFYDFCLLDVDYLVGVIILRIKKEMWGIVDCFFIVVVGFVYWVFGEGNRGL